ncbi:piggyBac transposable element-derived protein 1-like [Bactrocera dorsalis]|uniref:PiggyBac transposable element-derived protein 1-like n=1 Tax=Bactrocera dorsalis TaxID=27457 RepID=A0ABM3JB58_BACDO|nr:piggyBac transposable element-derived protein 1-like [Bactrocera dorsalis]
MSVFRYPNIESYWSKHSLESVRVAMPSKRFYEIKKYLHFNDSSCMKKKGEEGYDQLYKVRPLIDTLNERFNSVPKSPRLCIDEQMCPTKMITNLRQYMPDKTHKYGVKLFVLCDSYGFSYNFEVYRGAGENDVVADAPDLGATGNVVVRLTQTVPNFKNHIVYFDNFYTSLPLLVYLRSRGIYALGTVRANRLPNCKLSKDIDVKNKERGYAEEFVGTVFGVDITSVLWKDTQCVRLVSTYAGVKPFCTSTDTCQSPIVTRFDRKKK